MNLRDSLADIYTAHGQLTPRLVVDTAKDPAHWLHSQFEWDNEIAGDKYRLEQARRLIRAVRVVDANGLPNESVRTYHALPQPEGGHAYKSIEDIKEDPFQRELLLREAEREWRQMFRRYGHLKEWLDMIRGDMDAA